MRCLSVLRESGPDGASRSAYPDAASFGRRPCGYCRTHPAHRAEPVCGGRLRAPALAGRSDPILQQTGALHRCACSGGNVPGHEFSARGGPLQGGRRQRCRASAYGCRQHVSKDAGRASAEDRFHSYDQPCGPHPRHHSLPLPPPAVRFTDPGGHRAGAHRKGRRGPGVCRNACAHGGRVVYRRNRSGAKRGFARAARARAGFFPGGV